MATHRNEHTYNVIHIYTEKYVLTCQHSYLSGFYASLGTRKDSKVGSNAREGRKHQEGLWRHLLVNPADQVLGSWRQKVNYSGKHSCNSHTAKLMNWEAYLLHTQLYCLNFLNQTCVAFIIKEWPSLLPHMFASKWICNQTKTEVWLPVTTKAKLMRQVQVQKKEVLFRCLP